ncbi:MAG TPA: hypothetical protein VJS38_15460 [Phenylobacterium sp.]|uniref:hypothetical protein n=1 Tax=Phenylobacterium sp. TaxID=1871053 RepID=UPI002B4780FB|nr:hypothetical protein [Phenylobacterium sp.]HKR89570.1 hypothetical protein [Phenylobacterium sp.]
MILKKALLYVAAVAAMAAAAGVCVVAASYAIYAGLREVFNPAGASAIIAVGAAVVAAILAFVTFRKAQPRPLRRDEQNLTTRLFDLAREKPVIAAGAVVAAALVLLRNPTVVGAAVSAAMASRARDAGHRDGRRHKR